MQVVWHSPPNLLWHKLVDEYLEVLGKVVDSRDIDKAWKAVDKAEALVQDKAEALVLDRVEHAVQDRVEAVVQVQQEPEVVVQLGLAHRFF